ncbi:hypothetical protein HGRIS_004129 [Hohenbuehelia grisea]|uniref:Hemerythrin-like domain-containing protein n=1 Tax=Hohenbuehelia grisea TaxID=104357 RepID=A0ABR3JIH8_9AGAR
MSASLSNAIKDDHRAIFNAWDQYQKAAGDNDAQTRWGNELMWNIAVHSAGEEIAVYPLFEKHLGAEGTKMANEDRADHLKVKKLLAKAEGMTVGSSEYNQTLETVMKELKEHIDGEENHDFPLLEPKLGEQGSKAAATSFERTKMFVPTRAHPNAPDRPPFETLAGFLAAPIDKLMDAFSRFPTEEMKKNAS